MRRSIASENLSASRLSSPPRNNGSNGHLGHSSPSPWRPSTSPSVSRYSPPRRGVDEDDEKRMKEEHKERLRRKTAEKV